MELRHVRYFVAVAEERNFTRAAARVGIGQPPLSQQIRSLEHELNAPLFYRRPHGVELTEAGEVFLPEARALLAQAERAARNARRGAEGKVGRLCVGFTGSAAFCPTVARSLRAFRRAYREVELSLHEANTALLLEQLAAETLDAAFIRPGRLDPAGVRVHTLREEPMVAVVPADHPLAKSKAIKLASLAGEPLVLFARAAGPSLFDEIITACREAGFEPLLGQEAPQITSVANLVAAEMGVSLVPASIMQIQVQGVAYLPLKNSALKARLALATRQEERSPVVRRFVECVELENRRKVLLS